MKRAFGSSQEQQRKAANQTGTVKLVGRFSETIVVSLPDRCVPAGLQTPFSDLTYLPVKSEPFPLIPAATHLFSDCLLVIVESLTGRTVSFGCNTTAN